MLQVKYVVDSGRVFTNRFDPKTGFNVADVVWISQPSATQRKGRAGRVSAGECVRLYTEDQYSSFDSEHVPEIQRAALDHLLLQLLANGCIHRPFMQFIFLQLQNIESLTFRFSRLDLH